MCSEDHHGGDDLQEDHTRFAETTSRVTDDNDDNKQFAFVDIIEHRIVPSGFDFPDHGIEYLTEFQNGETMWLREMCFENENGEYATKYVEYLVHNGIRYA